jgi:aspartyl/asparaginyl-tRNA synthetase
MNYSDGIQWLKVNEIKEEVQGKYYEFGEYISQYTQRQMIDRINEPILFCRSLTEMKPFYMQCDTNDHRLVESVNFIDSFFFLLYAIILSD